MRALYTVNIEVAIEADSEEIAREIARRLVARVENNDGDEPITGAALVDVEAL